MSRFFSYLRQVKKADLQKIADADPAAPSKGIARRTYAGYKALVAYRYAHRLWQLGFKRLALFVSARAKRRTAVDIHPQAEIGVGVFIDHGVGVVIGQTAEVGDGCVLYQGVTLGGTGKDVGKRHPTVGKNVTVCAGACILGPVKVGDGSKIGAGSVVLSDVPPSCTVVGVPGRIVKKEGVRTAAGDIASPLCTAVEALEKRVAALESAIFGAGDK